MKFKPKMYSFLRFVLSPILKVIFKAKYVNKNNLPKKGAYILVCNHVSAVDPVVVAIGQKHRYVHFMAKAELFEKKFNNWFFRSIGCFPVDRGKGDISSVKHFEEIVEAGEIMGIFIEGTRSKDGEFLKPKNGAALIAYHTQTPVIPVCITIINKKRVCHFGEPVTLEELGFDKGGAREYREASRRMMEKLAQLREQDLS